MQHSTQQLPPFGPSAPADTLPSAERKRSGHIFRDCPARDLGPMKKGTKTAPCGPCLARWQEHSAEAGRQQRAFDQAWFAAQVDPVHVPTGDYPGRRSEPRVDRFEAATPAPTKPAAKPNRFAGSCKRCGVRVEAEAGALTGSPGNWGVEHVGDCPPLVEAKARHAEPGVTWADAASEPGAYVRIADGAMIRVAVSRTSGKPYALLSSLSEDEDDQYLGAGRHLQGLRRATEAEARAYGLQTVRCCVCGTRLENPASKAAGIGPICAGKGF